MREIDPMNEPSEALLSAALHRLASAGERNAPAAVETGLMQRFRHHHQHRRRVQLMKAGAIAAAILFIIALTVTLVIPERVDQVTSSPSVQPRQQLSPVGPAALASSGKAQIPKSQVRAATVTSARAEQVSDEARFIPLPSYDPAVPAGDLQMVRLELTGSDLRMLGAPVAGDLSDTRVTADFITDRDGTPYAVRLVR